MSDTLTISRHWHKPTIHTTVTPAGIAITIPLEDFILAVKQEIGSVAMTFTRATFSAQLDAAIFNALEKIKEESIKVL
jgi:glutamate mutase epsilon subunit